MPGKTGVFLLMLLPMCASCAIPMHTSCVVLVHKVCARLMHYTPASKEVSYTYDLPLDDLNLSLGTPKCGL